MRHCLSIASTLVLLLAAPAAIAQTQDTEPSTPAPGAAQLPPEALDADREPYPGQPAYARAANTDAPVGLAKVIGKQVQTLGGEPLGEVEDILVDSEGAAHVLVALENKRVAIPWREMSVTRLNENIVVSHPAAEISALPAFEEGATNVGQIE
ncbi:PRC-barrel domain-containing protein [Indioceanicola profundi]|uniref:PRC-barrel domain-containing protein n=1 Tax=Indioceanicola profundi TaxID=2220096 RepID=UPI0013C3F037|nr:PRC-barrel domain-containing protein [Indioceanicola profundi]